MSGRRSEPTPIGPPWWITPTPAERRLEARLWQFKPGQWGVGYAPSYKCDRCPCIYDVNEFDHCPNCAAAEAHWRRTQAARDADQRGQFGNHH